MPKPKTLQEAREALSGTPYEFDSDQELADRFGFEMPKSVSPVDRATAFAKEHPMLAIAAAFGQGSTLGWGDELRGLVGNDPTGMTERLIEGSRTEDASFPLKAGSYAAQALGTVPSALLLSRLAGGNTLALQGLRGGALTGAVGGASDGDGIGERLLRGAGGALAGGVTGGVAGAGAQLGGKALKAILGARKAAPAATKAVTDVNKELYQSLRPHPGPYADDTLQTLLGAEQYLGQGAVPVAEEAAKQGIADLAKGEAKNIGKRAANSAWNYVGFNAMRKLLGMMFGG